jgi:hypothetical protein
MTAWEFGDAATWNPATGWDVWVNAEDWTGDDHTDLDGDEQLKLELALDAAEDGEGQG